MVSPSAVVAMGTVGVVFNTLILLDIFGSNARETLGGLRTRLQATVSKLWFFLLPATNTVRSGAPGVLG